MKRIPLLIVLICCSVLVWAETVPIELLSQARHIRIIDKWAGLSPLSPVVSDYTLERGEAQLTGKALFSVAGGSSNQQSVSASIVIPEESWRKLIAELASSHLSRGTYKPTFTHTDDYPSLEIQFQTPSGPIVFFTQSQGRVPWGFTMAGHSYVIKTDEPGRALEGIAPYMHRDIMEALEKRAKLAMQKSNAPVTSSNRPGHITITSVPPQAKFFMDGQFIAMTPVVVNLSCTKPHKLRVSLEGYVDWESTFDCKKGSIQKFSAVLQPK